MDNYIGEIRLVGFNFAPIGWLACNGQILSIAQYDTLFALLGTTYGGDGQTTFGLPDLRSRLPMAQGILAGNAYTAGQTGGSESATLNANQLPSHSHPVGAQSAQGQNVSPAGSVYASSPGSQQYQPSSGINGATGNMLAPAGGNGAHENRMPFLAVNYIIATTGIYPSPS